MTSSDPRLKATYTWLYLTLPWPAPLPRPEEVRFCWNRRFRRTRGACQRKDKIIEINVIYRDRRLREELEHLLIHEAAHFLWTGHPSVFREFLRGVGVPEGYVSYASKPSPIYRLVQAERAQPPLFPWGQA